MLNALLLNDADTDVNPEEVKRISLLLGEWPALASLLYSMGGTYGRVTLHDVHVRWFPRVVHYVATGKNKLFCQRYLAGYEKLQRVPSINLTGAFTQLQATAQQREQKFGRVVNGLYRVRSSDSNDADWARLLSLGSQKLGSRC